MLIKQKIKDIQSLGQKKFRDQSRCFIAEGPKLVKEIIIAHPSAVTQIYGTAEWLNENKDWVDESKVYLVEQSELERISQLTTPNKVLAVVQQFPEEEEIVLQKQVTLVLDTIQDPGNFGTIVRIADWFGIKQIVAGSHSADLYNPKVVQATMGSIARVKVFYRDLHTWLERQEGIPVFATTLDGEPINKMDKISEGILLVGNESKGISDELLKFTTKKITIPRKGNAESLNAAVATGIVLYHFL